MCRPERSWPVFCPCCWGISSGAEGIPHCLCLVERDDYMVRKNEAKWWYRVTPIHYTANFRIVYLMVGSVAPCSRCGHGFRKRVGSRQKRTAACSALYWGAGRGRCDAVLLNPRTVLPRSDGHLRRNIAGSVIIMRTEARLAGRLHAIQDFMSDRDALLPSLGYPLKRQQNGRIALAHHEHRIHRTQESLIAESGDRGLRTGNGAEYRVGGLE